MIQHSAVPVPLFGTRLPCASYPASEALISKFGHGGARENSGGARSGAGRKPNPPAKPDFPAAPPDRPRWYCVRTYYQAEKTADMALRLIGFTVFSPSLWLPAIKAWRNVNGAIRPAMPARIAPLFPRYLFVRFNLGADSWKRIRRLPGIDYLFASASGTPIALPDQAIELIRSLSLPEEGRMAANDCLYPHNVELGDGRAAIVHAIPPAPPLAIGTAAQVTDGPMARPDLAGICTWSDGKRVRLLMTLLGRDVPVTMEQARAEAVRAEK